MSLTIKGLSAYLIEWPFKYTVEHSLARNISTQNLIIKIWDQQDRCGYGEGVPRSYVTGETAQASLEALSQELGPLVLGRQLEPEKALGWLASLAPPPLLDRAPAAACALETALLDLAARAEGRSVGQVLGGPRRQSMIYSGVAPLLPSEQLGALLMGMKAFGLREVKLKLKQDDDLQTLAQARQVLGPQARLRVDANCAWSPQQAVENIGRMAQWGVEAVEQPVAADDLEGLAWVSQQVEPLVLADESVCTPAQAQDLIQRRAVGGFNLRLSKCGGPMRTLQMLQMARQAGLACQLGCQVGELGLLSALGLHFAAAHPDLIYLEGCLTKFYVQGELIEQDLSFGPGGQAVALGGPGLGVSVDQSSLEGCLVLSLP